MMHPKVTVLMPCYNAEAWLTASVNSVLSQTFDYFEFIIVDDGSTDNSLAILKEMQKTDRRIVIFTKANTGLADSLNLGLSHSRGEWIARIDADDICEPGRLKKQFDLVCEQPELVFVGTSLVIIDENSISGARFTYPEGHDELLQNLILAKRFPPHSSAFYRRSSVIELGGYRRRVRRAEDWDLWLRLSTKGRLACIQEPLVRIRKHSGQVSLLGADDQIIDCRIAIISYLLVQSGKQDPIDKDLISFNCFRDWVNERLVSEDYFVFTRWKTRLRSSKNVWALIKYLVLSFGSFGFWLKLAREKMFGDGFGIRMSRLLEQ